MKFAASCLLFGMGCQAPASLTGWSHRDAIQNAAASEELSRRIEQDSPGLQSQMAQNQPAKSLDEHIRLGQAEISEWYRDKSPQRLKTARTHFDAALAMTPQSSSAHHGMAIIADLEGKFTEAEQHYQQALIQKPNDSDILGDMGYSYLLQNRLSESEQYSLRAVQANSKNVNAIKHLGDAYARQGKTQLAEETYAKVYSPEEVQTALAENLPTGSPFSIQTDKTNSSIFDRLIPGKTPAEKLTADIQRRQQEYNEQLQRQTISSSRTMDTHPGFNTERLAQESRLKQQLAEIDRQEMAHYQDGPILVDDRTGQLTRLPGAENSAYGTRGGPAATNFGAMSLQAPQPAYAQGQPQSPIFADAAKAGQYGHQQYDHQLPPQSSSNSAGQPSGMMGFPRTADASLMAQQAVHPQPQYAQPQYPQTQYPQQSPQSSLHQPGAVGGMAPMRAEHELHQSSYENSSQFPQQAFNTQQQQQPWTGIQQANATSSGGEVHSSPSAEQSSGPMTSSAIIQANGQANVPQNYGNLPQSPPANGFHPQNGPVNGPPGMAPGQGIVPGQGHGAGGAFAAMSAGLPNQNSGLVQNSMLPGQRGPAGGPQQMAPGDAYQQASRAAARMGMGLGPGGIFPVTNVEQTISPPGSMSYDSAKTPQPQRWMPDAVPPPNLNDAYQPYPNPVRPPAATTGPTPPVTYPSYSKEQFGTASRYDTRTMQNSNIPQDYNSSMQGYETQRWIAGREANIAVQQIWNQGPVNSPVSPSAGSLYTHPTAQGMMFTPNAPAPDGHGLMPEQWPHPPRSQPDPADQSARQEATYYQQNTLTGVAPPDQNFSQQSLPNQNPASGIPAGGLNQQRLGAALPDGRPLTGNQPDTAGSQGIRRSRDHIVIPTDYRAATGQNPTPSSPENGNRVSPAGGSDTSLWPTITPASR